MPTKKEKTLVIVESPTKSRTIQKFIGSSFSVLSSFGHIRDLPKSKLGIDVENNFEAQYVIPAKARKTLKTLKDELKKSSDVILATDEDREGEAIAFHLKEALDLKDYQRIVFHEITKEAIKNALDNPRKIDMNLVYSQFGRRILDRLVGYKLSPLLWKKIARGLSAGRVQSAAVRLIVKREDDIKEFKSQEYWTIQANLEAEKEKFLANLNKKNDKVLDKFAIPDQKEAEKITEELKNASYVVSDIQRKETIRNPLSPFTTSSLQQTAFAIYRFPARKTMFLAQGLYETGLITYHRTDSLNISGFAINQAKEYILKEFTEKYHNFRQYKTKSKLAQEAHESIRPTDVFVIPESLKEKLQRDQLKLYDLIWKRFLATQMKPAIFDSISVDIKANNYGFVANGQTLKFNGFLKIYPMKFEETTLPNLKEDQIVDLIELLPKQHFTEPPSRYTEATLIKALEENGIGRPSTYAPIISTIQTRNYVEKDDKKKLMPTEIGTMVDGLLVKHFPEIVDLKFTAEMEKELDEIAEGQKEWTKVMHEFYTPFSKNLEKKHEEIAKKETLHEKIDEQCPDCGSDLVLKMGRFGKFIACSNFPKCKYTRNIKDEKKDLDIKCPKCKTGDIVEKRTKRRKIFYGCSSYPNCDFASWDKPKKEICKECGWPMAETKRKQKHCSNPDCPALKKD
ncbi:MAG: type I DNA topoisomerase [Candidatus Paceibacterota bacterium]|jgi:DNA topoisomerase-1